MEIKYKIESSVEAQKRKDQLQLPVLIGMTLILMMLVFMVDTIANPDIAFGVGYIVVVLFSWLFPKNIYSVLITAACALLVLYDFTATPNHQSAVALPNLALTMGTLGITLLLMVLTRSRTNDIKKLNSNLEDEVSKRTFELQSRIEEIREKNKTIKNTQQGLLDAVKTAQDSEKRFKKLFGDAPDAILMVDESGTVVNSNKKVKSTFGYPKSELTDKKIDALMPSFNEVLQQFDKTEKKGNTIEVSCLHKNGKRFIAEISLNPLRINDATINSIAVRDITVRKEYEQLLRLQNNKMEAKNKELEQFVYIASHDLQEPVRTVSTFSQILSAEYADRYDDDAKTMFMHINQSTDRMSHLLKGLLDYGRLGRDPEKKQVDCNILVQEVCNDLSAAIQSSNAIIQAEDLPTLTAYETELRVLFQNLIGNALKFKKPNNKPIINIGAKRLENKWQMHVRDNGIGINQKHQEKIFTIFQRLHKRDEYEGHGIGLAKVKKIVELHEGEISVSAEPQVGTTFLFTISDTIL